MIITFVLWIICSECLIPMHIHSQKRLPEDKLEDVAMSCMTIKCSQFNKIISIKIERASSNE